MRRATAFLAISTVLVLGCGGQVLTPSQSSNTTSGDGGASATGAVTASGAGGMGGYGGSVVASTSTGTEPADCDPATEFVDIFGDGPDQHFDASCDPDAHLNLPGGAKSPPAPGPPPPEGGSLSINACLTSAALVLLLYGGAPTWPGSGSATVLYSHAGADYGESPALSGGLDIQTFGPVGGVIEGTFAATVAPKDPKGIPAKINLTGKFRICRGANYVPV